jgi:hypothetical protein
MKPTFRISSEALARRALHLTLGVLLLFEAGVLALYRPAIEVFARTGYPDWVRGLLAWAEIIAAALFLLQKTRRIGGGLLIAVLLGAIGLHLKRGDFPGPLVIYIMVIVASLAEPDRAPKATAALGA